MCCRVAFAFAAVFAVDFDGVSSHPPSSSPPSSSPSSSARTSCTTVSVTRERLSAASRSMLNALKVLSATAASCGCPSAAAAAVTAFATAFPLPAMPRIVFSCCTESAARRIARAFVAMFIWRLSSIMRAMSSTLSSISIAASTSTLIPVGHTSSSA